MLRSSLLSLLIIDLVGAQKASPLVGTVWALNVLPGAFLGVFAGIYLDRAFKRRVLIITSWLGVLQASMLAVLAYHDVHHVPIWAIMTITLFTGFTNTIDGIGRNAILKDAVLYPEHNRPAAILFTSLYTFGMIVGNGLAGWLVNTIGYGSAFMINAVSYTILIFGLSRMDFSHLSKDKGEWPGMWESGKSCIRYSFGNPLIRLCIILAVIVTVFGYSYNVILSIINKLMFNGDREQYGFLAFWGGVGSLVGSLAAIFFSDKKTQKFVVSGCLLIGISLIALANTHNVHFAAFTLFLCGLGFMAAFVPIRGEINKLAGKENISKVLGVTFMFFYGGMMVSSFGSGYIAKHYGCPLVLMGCGGVLILTAACTPFLPGIEKLDQVSA